MREREREHVWMYKDKNQSSDAMQVLLNTYESHVCIMQKQ